MNGAFPSSLGGVAGKREGERHLERGITVGPFESDFEQKIPKSAPTSAKLPQKVSKNVTSAAGFLSVSEAAKRLGKSVDTIIRWCETGKLPAFPQRFGTKVTFLIPSSSIHLMRQAMEEVQQVKQQSCSKSIKPHIDYFKPWLLAMEKGLMTGRPFSPLTIRDYETHVRTFLTVQKAVSSKTLEIELLKIPTAQYGKRFKLYKGVVCFAKFLIRKGALNESFLNEVKPLFPKRHTPPKRTSLDETQLKELNEVALTPFHRMMVVLLFGTGLRVSEAVALRRSDIDFERHTLIVQKGKGNKSRTLGLSPTVLSVVREYLESVESEWVFCDETGRALSRTSLSHRLMRLGKRAGITVSPHVLRRAFVTINAGKGRPLVYLQKSCGHSDIRTTMGYCLTTEQEVIEAMKEWYLL